ncbi:hypothetical protein [Piscinibacter terrae]|jgi:hypothetical protein|uniref:Uncharacterized protein n=1 Tax=Piscinibacter terrae TaxID=2496871 RepID=A0A3N7HNC9_9BURK|nr:hypothetical protein [Albitalea terrae]RQP23677.1 hypothetical protein DZC73_16230 [Albitalea terrae]
MRILSNMELQAVGGGDDELQTVTITGLRMDPGMTPAQIFAYNQAANNQASATLGIGGAAIMVGAAVLTALATPEILAGAIVVSVATGTVMLLGAAAIRFQGAFGGPGG